jgi:catechol 2,3-dioxygenase-like lactoylglutathione lyase family enzyme
LVAAFRNRGLDHVAVAVTDIERSRRFYEEVVGLEREHEEWDIPVVMAAGGSGVALFPADAHTGANDDAEPPEIRLLHIAFRLDRQGFDAARDGLANMGVEARFSDHGIAHSLYFTDPDGHQLELTTYEV